MQFREFRWLIPLVVGMNGAQKRNAASRQKRKRNQMVKERLFASRVTPLCAYVYASYTGTPVVALSTSFLQCNTKLIN